MKKISVIFVFILVLLSGCSLFQKQEQAPAEVATESKVERLTGVLNTPDEIGLMSAPAPFMLFAENGQQIFVNSVGVNLKKYKKRRVEAEGRWNTEKTIFMIENVTAIGNEMQVKTSYQNTDFGIKFQYPSIWSLKEDKNLMGATKVVITPYEVTAEELASVDSITIERSENNRKASAREWLGLDEQYRLPGDPLSASKDVYQQSLIGVAQLDAVKKVSGTGDRVDFYVSRDTFMYRFSHVTMNDSDKDMYRNAFYDLVMSFEFVPFTTVPSQKNITPPKITTNDKKVTQDTSFSKLAEEELAKRRQAEELQKQAEAQKTQQASVSASRQAIIDYVKSHITELAPEAPAEGAQWSVKSVEFAFPEGQPDQFNAVYVIYGDGKDTRKILLSISDRSAPEKMSRIAYFKPGDVTDWSIADGTDSAKGSEKSVVPVSGTGGVEIIVKKGMRLLESRSWKINIQYPANWYWAFQATGMFAGYRFSTNPVTPDNIMLGLRKDPATLYENEPLPPMSPIEDIGGRPAMYYVKDRSYIICVQGKSKYCIQGYGVDVDESVAKNMLSTLQED